MREEASAPPRFVVRQESKGWMVYDRQRKGPALIDLRPAINLTREQADRINRELTALSRGKHP
jgi:hypothetical protein